jgi:hypothetical protein
MRVEPTLHEPAQGNYCPTGGGLSYFKRELEKGFFI